MRYLKFHRVARAILQASAAAFIFSLVFGTMADNTGFTLLVYILITALIAGAFLWFLVDPSKQLVINEET